MNHKDRNRWMTFADAAWSAAGRPESLNPGLVESDPIAYDRAFYDFFEQRYLDLWLDLYGRVKPEDGQIIKEESPEFREAWRRNFSWETIWKQVLPLFVYGGTLGVDNRKLVELAAHYCVAQAIPSVVIDRIIDGGDVALGSDAAFCMLAYAKGINGIRSLHLPSADAIEDCLVSHTRDMYDSMLTEEARRFVLPPRVLSELIGNYFSPKGRLLSSIFFGVLPRWAYMLSGEPIPGGVSEAVDALRSVRQLNDELSDVDEDLAQGLITLPWLYALEEDPDLRDCIDILWRNREEEEAGHECRARLGRTTGMQRAHSKSLTLLAKSMNSTAAAFSATHAFEIAALHNVRWAHLARIAQNGFVDLESPRQPGPPNKALSVSYPIVPVGGAGLVVFNERGHVLMALVLKRGMVRWELPAGVAKDGESMEQAAERETLEETGVRIDAYEPIAVSWHYSRELGKGWMGLFFNGRTSDDSRDGFIAITHAPIAHNKVNAFRHPELYQKADLDTFDFERLQSSVTIGDSLPTAYENVLAAGFVDWKRIPEGRLHPLHRQLLESPPSSGAVELLVRDADNDRSLYNGDAPLYFK